MGQPSDESFAVNRLLLQHATLLDRTAIDECLKQWSHHMAPEVRSFARSLLRQSIDPAPSGAQSELALVLEGWTSYYNAGDYQSASTHFRQAFESGQFWSSWSALGLGKVCSDLGAWNDSRKWILHAMRCARRENDLHRMAECYGALAEVLFRTSHFKPAYELFTHDDALLPPGHEQHGRLANYLSVTLGRMNHVEMAEPMLWASLYRSIDNDPISAEFSLCSLHVLSFLQGNESLFARLQDFEVTDHHLYSATFLRVVRALWDHEQDRTRQAIQTLEAILELTTFQNPYPIESLWIRSLHASWVGDPVETFAEGFLELGRRQIPSPPTDLVHDVIDEVYLYHDISPEYERFANLHHANASDQSGIRNGLSSFLI